MAIQLHLQIYSIARLDFWTYIQINCFSFNNKSLDHYQVRTCGSPFIKKTNLYHTSSHLGNRPYIVYSVNQFRRYRYHMSFFKRENIIIVSTYITVIITSLTLGIIVSNYLIYDAVNCSLKSVKIKCNRKLKSLKKYLTCVSVFEVVTLSLYLFVVYSNLYISTPYIHIVLVQILFSITIVSHEVIFVYLKNRS